MKKLFISTCVLLTLLFAFSSCKKIAALFGGTDVNAPQINVTIPAVFFVTSNELSLGSYSFYFNLDSAVRANTGGVFGQNAVNSIKIKQVNINVTNADQVNNLANFEKIRITLQSNSNTTPVELFAITFPDVYASTYSFSPTNNPELLSYLKGSTITYNIYGNMRRITTKPLDVSVDVLLRAN